MKRRFHDQIAAGYGVFRRRRLGEAWVLGTSLLLPLAAVGVGLAMLLRYTTLGGWVGPFFLLTGIGVALWAAARFGLRHHLSRAEFVRHLERRLSLKENDLVNALEMEERSERMADPLTRGLAKLSVEQGLRALGSVSFARLAPALGLRAPWVRIGGGVALLALLGAVAPGAFTSAMARLVRPGAHDLPPALVIQVNPGSVVVERGTSVLVQARLARAAGETPKLLHRAPGGAWKRVEMTADTAAAGPSAGRAFQATLSSVLEATDYLVAAGRAESETYRVRVIEPLRATGYQKRVEFPAYTGLAPVQELGADGNLSALVGSRATLVVYPSRAGAHGRLLIEGEDPLPLEAIGREELAVTIPVRRSIDYRIELRSEEVAGAVWQSDRFTLEAAADRMPVLFQLAPERNIVLPPEMSVQLELDCMDDFGLSRLELVYRRNDDAAQRERLANWQGNREARVSWPWALGEMGLIPGDRIRYHLELTDNDAISGPKTAVSPEGEIRLPSFEEMYASLDEDRQDQMESAQETMARQKDVAEDLKQALQEMKQNKNFRWEDQEQVKDLAERQQEVAERVQDLAQAMERSLERMEQSAVFSPEVLEKVQQINELVQEIQSPEFREQMKRLQEAIAQLDRSAVQRAMQNLQLTQEQLIQNLDRTLEMLKQLQREESLDRLIQQAENLLNEQKRLNQELSGQPADSTRAGENERSDAGERPGEQPKDERRDGASPSQPPSGQTPSDSSAVQRPMTPEESARLQERQDALREELRKLQEQIDQLKQEASKDWEKLNQQMEERKSEQSLSSASKNMQSASQQMQQQQRKQGLTFGRQAQQDLEQFAQGMRQAQAAMNGAEQEEVARKLYALSGNLVRLSQDQEELLRAAPARSTRDLAREQQRLAEGARKTLDELFELAKQSRFISTPLARAMGEAVRTLESAQQSWMDGSRPNGMEEGKAAGSALDATVLSLLNAGQSMCKGGQASSCSNPLQRMRSLSGQQESLNQETQQMMGQCSGGQRLSPGGSEGERLIQAAARQQMIRQGLSELQQSMQDESGLMGRIGDIGKEMEEVVEEMRHRGLDERVIRRQERILSRLLTAQRSLRKEGQKEERLSRTGVNPDDRESPAAYVPGANESEALQRGILRGSQDPVPGDFRRLVESYFRSLGAQR